MVLIGLLYEKFCDNFNYQKFPNHMIYVSKQEVLRIKGITFEYNLRVYLTNSKSLIDFSKQLTLSKLISNCYSNNIISNFLFN